MDTGTIKRVLAIIALIIAVAALAGVGPRETVELAVAVIVLCVAVLL